MSNFIRTSMGLEVYIDSAGDISELEDTDLTVPFSDIAGLPGIKQHPRAASYGVGMGTLVACDGNGNQIACWEAGDNVWR